MCAMKFRSLFCLAAFALPLGLRGAEEAATPAATLAANATPTPPPAATATATPTPKPSFIHRLMHPLESTKGKGAAKEPVVTFHNVELGMVVAPEPVKVSENKVMKVTLTLTNRSKKLVQLDFPTSQRVEVLLKTKDGKTIETWSQDQAFTNEPTLVTINPNERLEYSVDVSTRDMVAGQDYTVEGFFPNFDQLKKLHSISAK